MRVIAAAVLALALAVGATAHAAPGTRGPFASRLWTADDGLPSTASFGVGQDARGFVWVATSEGVARLDGARVTRVTPAGGDLVLGPGAADRIVVRDPAIGFADVGPSDALRPLAVPVAPVASAQVDRRGRLWVTGADRVVVDGEGEFRDVTGPWGPEPRVIGAADDGAVFVEALGRLLRVTPDRATDLGPCTDALRAVERGDGSVVYIANRDRAANNQATVVALRDGVPRTVFDDPARGIDLARRGPDLFAVLDRAVVRLGADDRAEDLLGPSTCCGSALVDREGGLWISGELGLRHLPNPRTTSWVPDGGMIRIAPAPHGLWITTWGGIRHLGPADEYLEWPTRGMTACPDARGDAWMVGRTAIHRLREGAEPEPLPGVGARGAYLGCASGDRGRAWFASPFALAVADPASPIPHLVPGPTPVIPDATSGGAAAVLEIDGEVLYGTRDRLCHAPLDRVLTDADPGWSCVVLPPRAALQDLERAADGVAWAVVRGVGVVRSEAPWDTWTPIPASAAIRVGTLGFATASTRGGVWILAEGDVLRVEDRPDEPGGWRVVDELGPADGLRPGTPRELVETADGVWLAMVDGALSRVLDDGRAPPQAPPQVFVTSVGTDAGPHDPAAPLALPASGDRLELQFAAPVFGRRTQLAYRYRLRPDDPWSAPIRNETLRFAALGPGTYAVEIGASLDGERWTDPPARFAFRVRAPWYLQPWFLLGAAAALAGVLAVVHRARVRAATRLERQRARIARDLHDEIGSGLGSIGLLAGVAARRGSADGAALAERIGSLAAELGTGLTDIVTALRRGAANLRALHGHVVERGTAACVAGRPRFEAAQASAAIPTVPLSLPVRINLFLIAVEAIHNAVRHAGADVVTLALEPAPRGRWRLTVADDGMGLPTGSPPIAAIGVTRGVGLRAMQERADEIGATLSVRAGPAGGTRVTVEFDPAAEEQA